MQITAAIIERNARRNNIAVYNGLDIQIVDAPTLVGSEKQVAWAASIREKAIKDVIAQVAAKAGLTKSMQAADEMDAGVEALNAKIEKELVASASETSASRWIDANSTNGLMVFRALAAK